MFACCSRIISTQSFVRLPSARFFNTVVASQKLNQMEYIKSVLKNEDRQVDWSTVKNNILSLQGVINSKNVDGILLKTLTHSRNFDAALSFVEYLNKNTDNLALGSMNGVLGLYFEISKIRKLTAKEKKFIQDSYKHLYEKYKLLDYATCEKLLRALCAIDDCDKSLKVLENIYDSAVPSHEAYSTLIGTLFRNKKKKKALEIIQQSISNDRPLQYYAYEGWIEYIFKSYKENKTIIKYMEEIFSHISTNCAVIDEITAGKFKEVFEKLGWEADHTKIRKMNGQCIKCRETLDCQSLSQAEFETLQKTVKDRLIVGSDLFQKSSPEELKNFLQYIEHSAPYDIVIDALNVAYAIGKGSNASKINLVNSVVKHFKDQNKKILLIGRKHMLKWNIGVTRQLQRDVCCFFTDNISQDDPYFITAAILSGPHTDIVSKDLLRTHQFQMKERTLVQLFKRWQWQHQWMVFHTYNKGPKIQAPLTFTPCAQKKVGWHIPYKKAEEKESNLNMLNDGVPDLSSWLCVKPKLIQINKVL